MAKRVSEQTPQRPNSSLRVRWVEVEVNGADTTIEEALRTVERMRRPVIETTPTTRRIAIAKTAINGHEAAAEPPTLFDHVVEGQADAFAAESGEDVIPDIAAGVDPGRKKRGEGDRKDHNAGIKPVGDIDFVPADQPSLKTLFAEKAPASDMEQILVICHFLQHTLQCDRVGPGHILSGFRHVAKPIPKSLKQTIRNMKNKKAWLSFTEIENIRLSTEGDNHVEHELGKGSGDAGS